MDNLISILLGVGTVLSVVYIGGWLVEKLPGTELDKPIEPPNSHPLDEVQIITIRSKVLHIKVGVFDE